MAGITHPTIGCCGIDCGLCPRYYTDGPSRCPAGEVCARAKLEIIDVTRRNRNGISIY
jgi:hypothetical protein